MLGMVEGERQQGRPARRWMDDILMWCDQDRWLKTAKCGENSWLRSYGPIQTTGHEEEEEETVHIELDWTELLIAFVTLNVCSRLFKVELSDKEKFNISCNKDICKISLWEWCVAHTYSSCPALNQVNYIECMKKLKNRFFWIDWKQQDQQMTIHYGKGMILKVLRFLVTQFSASFVRALLESD